MDFIIVLLFILIVVLVLLLVRKYYLNSTKVEYAGAGEPKHIKKFKMDDDLLELVQDGKKTIDVRLNNPVIDTINDGDNVMYFSEKRDIITKLKKKQIYDNLDQLIEKEKMDNVFPEMKNKSVDKIKNNFLSHKQGGKGYYTQEQLDKPFVALHINACCN